MGRDDALPLGVGMISRGEGAMVVAQFGLTMGVMSQPVYGVVVLMAVATTLIAPPMIKFAFKKDAREVRHDRGQVALEVQTERQEIGDDHYARGAALD